MKQIFDWLREQIKDASFRPFNEVVVYEESVQNLINEAEAKWEADCCEWKTTKRNSNLIASPHMALYQLSKKDLKDIPYCPYCGKPIKISEVE